MKLLKEFEDVIMAVVLLSILFFVINFTNEDKQSNKSEVEKIAISCMEKAKDNLDKQRECSSNFMRDSNKY